MIAAIACSMASSVGSTMRAASATTSGKAPPSETTAGTPHASASSAGKPNPSKLLGRQNAVAPAISAANCSSETFWKISGGGPSPALNSSSTALAPSRSTPGSCVTTTNRCGKPRAASRAAARRSRTRILAAKQRCHTHDVGSIVSGSCRNQLAASGEPGLEYGQVHAGRNHVNSIGTDAELSDLARRRKGDGEHAGCPPHGLRRIRRDPRQEAGVEIGGQSRLDPTGIEDESNDRFWNSDRAGMSIRKPDIGPRRNRMVAWMKNYRSLVSEPFDAGAPDAADAVGAVDLRQRGIDPHTKGTLRGRISGLRHTKSSCQADGNTFRPWAGD